MIPRELSKWPKVLVEGNVKNRELMTEKLDHYLTRLFPHCVIASSKTEVMDYSRSRGCGSQYLSHDALKEKPIDYAVIFDDGKQQELLAITANIEKLKIVKT